jgi:hypothetical protein
MSRYPDNWISIERIISLNSSAQTEAAYQCESRLIDCGNYQYVKDSFITCDLDMHTFKIEYEPHLSRQNRDLVYGSDPADHKLISLQSPLFAL